MIVNTIFSLILLLLVSSSANASASATVQREKQPHPLRELINIASDRIKHVVVLMMENRSFDHMLGFLKQDYNDKINGITDGTTQPIDPLNPRLGDVPVTRLGYDVGPDDPLHDFDSIASQINNNMMNGFVSSAYHANHNITNPVSMFDKTTAPVINMLAQEFAVFDDWFCSVPGPTDPNRAFAMAGTSVGVLHNFNGTLWKQQSYFDYLTQHKVDWRAYYQQDPWAVAYFQDMNKPENSVNMLDLDSHFYDDVKSGSLARFVWLQPRLNAHAQLPTWQHPDAAVSDGEGLIKQVYEALRQADTWQETLFLITYDEHGGFYDHVAPPVGAPNPDGINNENGFSFNQLGIRIPTVAISPWIPRGTIVSHSSYPDEFPTPSSQFESTSIMHTVNLLMGLGDEPMLGLRAPWSRSFLGLVSSPSMSSPRSDCPTSTPAPYVTPTLSLSSSLFSQSVVLDDDARLSAQRSKPISDHMYHQLLFLCSVNYPVKHAQGECEGVKQHVKANQGTASDWIVKEVGFYESSLRFAELEHQLKLAVHVTNGNTDMVIDVGASN